MTNGAKSRDKGAVAERAIVAMFKEAGWPDAHRTSNGTAQIGRGDIGGIGANLYVEIKRQERLNVPAALDQVKRDARPLDVPLLVHRPSRHEWMATMPLVHALRLLKAAGY
jgi:Holliday junction resolvase